MSERLGPVRIKGRHRRYVYEFTLEDAYAVMTKEPGAVIVSSELRFKVEATAPGEYSFASIGPRSLRGFDAPAELHVVTKEAR